LGWLGTLGLLGLTLGTTTVRAATNYVLVGQALQPAIDASAPGDMLVIQAGVYPDSPNFNKPLTVLRSGTNQIQFIGSVQITGTGDHYYSQCEFSSTVSIQCTGVVSFVQSQFLAPLTSTSATLLMSGVNFSDSVSSVNINLASGSFTNLQVYDSFFDDSLTITGGKSLIKRTRLQGLTLLGNASLECLRMTNDAATTATATVGGGASFLGVQCSLTNSSLTGYSVSLAYSLIRFVHRMTNCDALLLGNTLTGADIPRDEYGVSISGGTMRAYNNLIIHSTTLNGSSIVASTATGIELNLTTAEFQNNTWRGSISGAGYWTGQSRQFYLQSLKSLSSILTVRGDLFVTVSGSDSFLPGTGAYAKYARFIDKGSGSAYVSYCDFYGASGVTTSAPHPGVTPLNSLYVNPQLTGASYLSISSPCIDAGPPEGIYSDRDASSNDMGYTGGPYWNPANYTNDNPMVFFIDSSPRVVFKGAQTNLQINVGASAGH